MKMLQQNRCTAKQAALRMLSRKSYSEQEVRQRLQAQGFVEDSIDEVISLLKERGYLDDTALCAMLFAKLSTSSKYSLKIIIIKLKQRGIIDSIINDCIKDYQKLTEFETALKIVTKRYGKYDSCDQVKVSRYLTYKGFSANTITKVLEKLKCNM